MRKQKIGIVGAGIVGLAHAWSASERGHDVEVFERESRAAGASIRNFGMVWPIGQPEETRPIAMASRERWLQLSRHAGIWAIPCGSIHLAHRDDEWDVLNEFVELHQHTDLGKHIRALEPEACFRLSQAIVAERFQGGLYSDMELCVNPRMAIRALPAWLHKTHGVQFHFDQAVIDIGTGWMRTAEKKHDGFDRIVVCSGHDFESLFPDAFRDSGIRKCKLQMMRTQSQADGWRLGPHLASGLTLRHYPSFKDCNSLQRVIDRVALESPELDQFGIHVMASQNDQGHVVLGDSHEYGADIEPFDSVEIDNLILRELQKIIRLPSWQIESRWNGIYSKCSNGIAFENEPESSVHIMTGLGGNGMTLSFGLAEKSWTKWDEEYV
jgi:D-hydroxyproline dehydrogenase subunit beta